MKRPNTLDEPRCQPETLSRGYVSSGNNAVFIGSYEWLSVMNDVFG